MNHLKAADSLIQDIQDGIPDIEIWTNLVRLAKSCDRRLTVQFHPDHCVSKVYSEEDGWTEYSERSGWQNVAVVTAYDSFLILRQKVAGRVVDFYPSQQWRPRLIRALRQFRESTQSDVLCFTQKCILVAMYRDQAFSSKERMTKAAIFAGAGSDDPKDEWSELVKLNLVETKRGVGCWLTAKGREIAAIAAADLV